MNSLFSLLFGVVIALLFVNVPVLGRDITIGDPSLGSFNYTTIGEALANVSPSGDVFYLYGNFTGLNNTNLNLTGLLDLTIEGQGWDSTLVDCAGSGFPFVIFNLIPDLTVRYFNLRKVSVRNCRTAIQAQTGNMNISVDNCTFSGHTSSGLFIQGQRPVNVNQIQYSPIVLSVSNSIISGNSATATGQAPNFSGFGGGIYALYTNFTASNVQFLNNFAIRGGGLYVDEYYTMNWVVFLNNIATISGAGINSLGADGYVWDANITNNRDQGDGVGCGCRIRGGSLRCTRCSFVNNNCAAFGGAVEIENGGALFSYNSTYRGNQASRGGAIYNSGAYQLHFTDVFQSNRVGGSGGALALLVGAVAQVDSSTIQGNFANQGGAVFLEYSAILNAGNSFIQSNSASDDGGAIFCSDSTVNLTNTVVSGNTAPVDPDFHCSDQISGTVCKLKGNSPFQCLPEKGQRFFSPSQIIGIFVACFLGCICLGFMASFVIYFSNKKNRIAQGFVWSAVGNEENE